MLTRIDESTPRARPEDGQKTHNYTENEELTNHKCRPEQGGLVNLFCSIPSEEKTGVSAWLSGQLCDGYIIPLAMACCSLTRKAATGRNTEHSECFLQVEIEWEKAQYSNFCEIYDWMLSTSISSFPAPALSHPPEGWHFPGTCVRCHQSPDILLKVFRGSSLLHHTYKFL